MPEGWQAPSAVENLIGEIGDLFGDSPPGDEPLALEDRPLEPRRPEDGPPMVRPTAPQPQPDRDRELTPPQQGRGPPSDRRPEPLFF
jgi:penicillin-binding protein 1A